MRRERLSMRVVAAALLRSVAGEPQVLAARRRYPAELAGGWEFPGGKVEPGESDQAALARECREELGVDVTVGAVLGTATDGRIELVLYAAAGSNAPAPGADHDALRWLSETDLETVAWLPIDARLLPEVAATLRPGYEPGTVSRSDNDGRRRDGEQRADDTWTR